MRLLHLGPDIRIALSRRNLLTLLAQLDANRDPKLLQRYDDSGLVITAVAEEDAEHYGEREPGYPSPDRYGPMREAQPDDAICLLCSRPGLHVHGVLDS